MNIEQDEKIFFERLRTLKDFQGIVRYDPHDLEKELQMLASDIEKLLEKLYVRGILVYVTRVNKNTGKILKIVQLIEEEYK